MDLSRERLETVAHFLKEGGFKGELELVPKGETEPFTGVVRSQYGKEELFQLDRRVELLIDQALSRIARLNPPACFPAPPALSPGARGSSSGAARA